MSNEKPDPRALRIMELQAEGYSTQEIADTLGVERTTIWRIKQRPTYLDLARANEDRHEALLNDMEKDKQTVIRLAVMQERGRRSRSSQKLMMREMENRFVRGDFCQDCPGAKFRNMTDEEVTKDRKKKEKLVKDLREKFIPKERHREFMEWLMEEVE